MTNLMQTAAAWLGSQLSVHAARSVVVIQGQRLLDAIDAWCSRQSYEVTDSEGFATTAVSYDWQFVASDLPDDFVFREGAIFQETLGGVVRKYEAMPMASQPCYEDLDDSGVLLTVHTKRVM